MFGAPPALAYLEPTLPVGVAAVVQPTRSMHPTRYIEYTAVQPPGRRLALPLALVAHVHVHVCGPVACGGSVQASG